MPCARQVINILTSPMIPSKRIERDPKLVPIEMFCLHPTPLPSSLHKSVGPFPQTLHRLTCVLCLLQVLFLFYYPLANLSCSSYNSALIIQVQDRNARIQKFRQTVTTSVKEMENLIWATKKVLIVGYNTSRKAHCICLCSYKGNTTTEQLEHCQRSSHKHRLLLVVTSTPTFMVTNPSLSSCVPEQCKIKNI